MTQKFKNTQNKNTKNKNTKNKNEFDRSSRRGYGNYIAARG